MGAEPHEEVAENDRFAAERVDLSGEPRGSGRGLEEPLTVKRPVEKPKPAAGTVYSVQIAAYNVKSQAAAMVAKLKKRGYEARVDGTADLSA